MEHIPSIRRPQVRHGRERSVVPSVASTRSSQRARRATSYGLPVPFALAVLAGCSDGAVGVTARGSAVAGPAPGSCRVFLPTTAAAGTTPSTSPAGPCTRHIRRTSCTTRSSSSPGISTSTFRTPYSPQVTCRPPSPSTRSTSQPATNPRRSTCWSRWTVSRGATPASRATSRARDLMSDHYAYMAPPHQRSPRFGRAPPPRRHRPGDLPTRGRRISTPGSRSWASAGPCGIGRQARRISRESFRVRHRGTRARGPAHAGGSAIADLVPPLMSVKLDLDIPESPCVGFNRTHRTASRSASGTSSYSGT